MGLKDQLGSNLLDDAIAVVEKYGFTWPLVVKSKPSRPVPPCGTPRAYHRHLRRGEPTCGPCRKAINDYNKERAVR